MDDYSGGNGNPTDAIRNYALFLDKDPSKLAILEVAVEEDMAQKTNVKTTSQQTFPKNCTSTQIGDYTYTNCY